MGVRFPPRALPIESTSYRKQYRTTPSDLIEVIEPMWHQLFPPLRSAAIAKLIPGRRSDSRIFSFLLLSIFTGISTATPTSLKLLRHSMSKQNNGNYIPLYERELKPLVHVPKIGYVSSQPETNTLKQFYQLQHALIPTLVVQGRQSISLYFGYSREELIQLDPSVEVLISLDDTTHLARSDRLKTEANSHEE